LSQSLLNGSAHWSATWFDGEFRNAIDFDPGPPPMLVNRNRVDSSGFELAGQLGVGEQWRFDGSVTNAKSRIASTGGELRNRPEWRAGLGAHWAPSTALKFSATATYVGTSFDSDCDRRCCRRTRAWTCRRVAGVTATQDIGHRQFDG
jgi:outer membrane receptor protein involved in Fe transport